MKEILVYHPEKIKFLPIKINQWKDLVYHPEEIKFCLMQLNFRKGLKPGGKFNVVKLHTKSKS